MLFLLLGAGALVALMLALGAFSRAQVRTIKAFGMWIVALGGLLLVAMLVLTGRGLAAIGPLVILGPMVWGWVRQGARPAVGGGARRPEARGAMSRAEALAVLGLQPGADAQAIRAAHLRLMRMAHPDSGGSDWLATRINQARDVLLG